MKRCGFGLSQFPQKVLRYNLEIVASSNSMEHLEYQYFIQYFWNHTHFLEMQAYSHSIKMLMFVITSSKVDF